MDSLCCLVRVKLLDLKSNVETALQVTHFCDVQCTILVLDKKMKELVKYYWFVCVEAVKYSGCMISRSLHCQCGLGEEQVNIS